MKGIPAQSTSNWPSRGFHTFFPQILMYPKISWCHQVSVRYADEDSLSGSVFSEFPLLASWSHCRLESLPEWIHPILEMLGCNEVWNPFFFPSNGCVTDEGWLWSSLPLHGTCLHSSVACRSSLSISCGYCSLFQQFPEEDIFQGRKVPSSLMEQSLQSMGREENRGRQEGCISVGLGSLKFWLLVPFSWSHPQPLGLACPATACIWQLSILCTDVFVLHWGNRTCVSQEIKANSNISAEWSLCSWSFQSKLPLDLTWLSTYNLGIFIS